MSPDRLAQLKNFFFTELERDVGLSYLCHLFFSNKPRKIQGPELDFITSFPFAKPDRDKGPQLNWLTVLSSLLHLALSCIFFFFGGGKQGTREGESHMSSYKAIAEGIYQAALNSPPISLSLCVRKQGYLVGLIYLAG